MKHDFAEALVEAVFTFPVGSSHVNRAAANTTELNMRLYR